MYLTFGSNNLYVNSSTTLSMLVGQENSQFPLSNTKHPFTTKIFRSLEDTISILVDTKTSTTKNMFAVVGNAVSGSGIGFNSLTIYGSNTTDFTSSTPIVCTFSDIYNFGFVKFTDCSFRYWKVDVSSLGDYVELSNIFLGEEYGFDTNTLSIAGFEFLNQDNSKIVSNDFSQKFITKYNSVKKISGDINYINRTEFDLLNYLYNTHGISTPLWMIYDETDASAIDGKYIFSGYYYFSKSPGFKAVGGQLWNSSLDFEEVI